MLPGKGQVQISAGKPQPPAQFVHQSGKGGVNSTLPMAVDNGQLRKGMQSVQQAGMIHTSVPVAQGHVIVPPGKGHMLFQSNKGQIPTTNLQQEMTQVGSVGCNAHPEWLVYGAPPTENMFPQDTIPGAPKAERVAKDEPQQTVSTTVQHTQHVLNGEPQKGMHFASPVGKCHKGHISVPVGDGHVSVGLVEGADDARQQLETMSRESI